MNKPILKVENLSKNFIIKNGLFSEKKYVKAVDGVSFEINHNEALGLIGSSGCGKSTVANLILQFLYPTSGSIYYDGHNLTTLSEKELRHLRKDLQIIFQHSKSVLDPKMTVYELLREPLTIHKIIPSEEIDLEIQGLLSMVSIPTSELGKYPTELSGGQKQRIIIARAIATRPKLIICDEPVSALDVSVQGQILNLLIDLKKELKLSYLFISHDLKVVNHICDRILVMDKGKIQD